MTGVQTCALPICHQVSEDLSLHGGTRHVLDIESPQNCTPLGYPSRVIGTSEYIDILSNYNYNSVPQKLSKLLIDFQFPSKPPNSKPSLILPIPFPEAKFHGIPVNSKTINGRFAVGFKSLQCSDHLHRSLHGSADPWP